MQRRQPDLESVLNPLCANLGEMREPSVFPLSMAMLVALLTSSAARAEDPKDPVEATWRARADLAKRRLAQGGLDACDTGLERAFQAAKQTKEKQKDGRTYDLSIDVGGQVLVVVYRYEGNQLDGFALVVVPPQFVAFQKADSKTFRFLLGPPQSCAFSLCTRGPTADGPCAETPRP
jgi:hypothetical protein